MSIPFSRSMLHMAGRTFIRFPFVLLCALAATTLLVIAAGLPQIDNELHQTLLKVTMAVYLGMLAGISCTVFCEQAGINKLKQYLLNLVIVLLMYLYYHSLPDKPDNVEQSRFILLIIACHALVSFTPYILSNVHNGFWQYNKKLFLRILTAAFYSHVLFLGLWLALLAIDHLFNLNIDDLNYLKLYFIVIGIFNTVFFLSGVPEDVDSLEELSDYPTGLKIFTQYILLPLVTLYLLILYTYGLKIIFTQQWPAGWVSYLVIGFSVTGILALLLVWPLRSDDKHRWIATYTRYFYLALLPLIALLFVAIIKRVMQYGITENRYFIIMLALWLLVTDLYFLVSIVKNIKIIPVSLFIFCLFSAYGPWSAYRTSEKSQLKRLKDLLQENQHLQHGKAVKSSYKVSPQNIKDISSASFYLINTHGLHSMQPLFTVNLDSLCSNKDSADLYIFTTAKVLGNIGIDYSNPYEAGASFGRQINLNAKNDNVILTKDFEYLLTFNIPGNKIERIKAQVFHLSGDSITLSWDESSNSMQLLYNNAFPVSLNILTVVDTLIHQYGLQFFEIAPAKMQYNLENGGRHYRIQLNSINARFADEPNGMELFNLNGQLLVGRD